MGLDDFSGNTSSVASTSNSGGGGGGKAKTKLDFSRPYIMVVRYPNEEIAADVGPARILKPEDNPDEDYEVLCKFSEKNAWKSFCSRVDDEFGLDAEKVLEKNPAKIPELKADLPKPNPPSPQRTCAVCGEKMNPDTADFQEMKLVQGSGWERGDVRLAVHSHHTVEELMEAKADNE